ncbi:unnamed protein product [Rotaria sp. Silwood2]|nr:unnamed protein product [Rotaria sp. Silwood2]
MFDKNIGTFVLVEINQSKRRHHLSESVLELVHICLKEKASLYAEVQKRNDTNVYQAYDYVRRNRKYLSIKCHTDIPIFVNEERVHFNGLVLLAEEEVDNVIMTHFGSKFGCGTRGLHQHLNKIYYKVSEARIVKVTKESTARGQMRPIFSNKGPKKIIQAKQVFERVQVDLVDLSRKPAFQNGIEYRYVLVVLDIFSRYMFLRSLTSKSAGISYIFKINN